MCKEGFSNTLPFTCWFKGQAPRHEQGDTAPPALQVEGDCGSVGTGDDIRAPVGKYEPVANQRFIKGVTSVQSLAQGNVEEVRLEGRDKHGEEFWREL